MKSHSDPKKLVSTEGLVCEVTLNAIDSQDVSKSRSIQTAENVEHRWSREKTSSRRQRKMGREMAKTKKNSLLC
jgi:hypothetical protein